MTSTMQAPQRIESAFGALGILVLGLSVALTVHHTPVAAQGVIDFEPDPGSGLFPDGSAAVDERPMSDAFRASHGVTFALDLDGDGLPDPGQYPLLEQLGRNPPDGFEYSATKEIDRAAPGYEAELGDWFLKALSEDVRQRGTAFLILYDTPTASAAGQIWDIDGTPMLGYEQWQVDGLNADGEIVAAELSPRGTGLDLDGRPWTFHVETRGAATIARIRIRFVGQKSKIGFVLDHFTPSLAPTPTATFTRSPTPSPTSTLTPTATPTPTQTARPDPNEVYLPRLLNDPCRTTWVRADVVLILDLSTSMQQPTSGGRTKLAAAQEAAHAFVDLMDFTITESGRHDQVAVVGFNAESWIAHPLSRDRVALHDAIDELADTTFHGTRLDLALYRGASALASEGRRPDNTGVIVLMTDGLPSQVPPDPEDGSVETTVLRAAAVAQQVADRLYTIGIGPPEQIDAALLAAAASDAAYFFPHVEPDDLADVYREIAYTLACKMSSPPPFH